MRSTTRRTALTLACAAAWTATLPMPAAAQGNWPDKPVKVIVPAPAGSSLDVTVRLLGEKLQAKWKQPLVVEARPGAGGMLGMDVVAKAAPDGHTLGIGFNGPVAFAPHLYRKMPYDAGRDLLPIVLTTSQPNVFAVPGNHPAKTFGEWLAWAKAQAGKASYASVGNGSSSHLAMELLKSQAGFEAVHVPFAGSPPAATSVAQGETHALLALAPAMLPLVQGGKLKLLAVTGKERLPDLKDLPTVAEAGLPGFEALAWNGLFAPAGTPAAVVDQINADVNEALKDPAVREAFAKQGLSAGGGSPAQFKAWIDAESAKWGSVIRKVGITLD